MPLEHFKTQVLLLHSQQSTLDTLSAGFGDRYAVHVATSGSEALNTLGETPIHVIVSAQDLPGMSGLEALREAKKRSPDTIGILLAGDSRDDGLEALVSDKEVFQIVRGGVTPDALTQLVDQATKRIRLLTLAESANDQAANVDEPVGEHIVMETSENGATIISDGTSRMRALRGQAAQISSHVGGRDVDVLVLTKDEDFLLTIRESSRGLHNVHHANTIAQAEAVVQSHKVGVLVTDAAMAGSDIEAMAGRLRSHAPRLVAIVAGRRDDGEMLMDLINHGHVYRFLLKPVSPGRARLAIEASVKHHLEAGESTFKSKPPGAAPAAQAKPAPRPAAAKMSPPKPPAGSRPGQEKAKAAAPARREPRMEPASATTATTSKPESDAPVAADGRLDGAFGESGRFKKTVSGLAETFGRATGTFSANSRQADAAPDKAEDSRRSAMSPKIIGAAAAAIAVVALLAWWILSPAPEARHGAVETVAKPADREQGTESSSEATTPSVVEAEVPAVGLQDQAANPAIVEEAPPSPPPYQAVLDKARMAREAGNVVAPAGDNAIELYVSARKMAPTETVIVDELAAAVDDALALAEAALLDGRGRDAATALRMVRLADPQNGRLTFLDAQVAQLELRARLDQARTAIRESRFEDAASALAAAQRVSGADRSEIDQLTGELATARSEQRLDEVLTLAGQRLADNALTEPANDNARYYYELAISNDTDNAAARQGLAMVASKLVLRARDDIDNGRLDDAERALQDAGALDPESSELAASLQALQSARTAEEDALQQAEARTLAAEQTTDGDTASNSSSQKSLPDNAGATTFALQNGDPDASPRSLKASAPTSQAGAGTDLQSSDSDATRDPGQNPTDKASEAGSSRPRSGASEFVAISTLQRTNYVAPRYPRLAQRRGITGWVDVSFSVLTDGSVADIEIMNADPQKTFDDSAIDAVADWRFEPPVEDGMPVSKRVAVRMMFNLQ